MLPFLSEGSGIQGAVYPRQITMDFLLCSRALSTTLGKLQRVLFG